MQEPTPEQYNPPLTWRSHAWRTAGALSISAVLLADDRGRPVAPGRAALFWLDLDPRAAQPWCCRSGGAVGRSPSRSLCAVLGAVSVSSAGPGVLASVSLATRRHVPQIVAVGVLGLVGAVAYPMVGPSATDDPWWITFAFGARVHGRDAGVGHVPRLAAGAALDAARPRRAGGGRAGPARGAGPVHRAGPDRPRDARRAGAPDQPDHPARGGAGLPQRPDGRRDARDGRADPDQVARGAGRPAPGARGAARQRPDRRARPAAADVRGPARPGPGGRGIRHAHPVRRARARRHRDARPGRPGDVPDRPGGADQRPQARPGRDRAGRRRRLAGGRRADPDPEPGPERPRTRRHRTARRRGWAWSASASAPSSPADGWRPDAGAARSS